jgi:hypothetical protein
MWALALNSCDGGNTRFSRSVESISWLKTAGTGPARAESGREGMYWSFGERRIKTAYGSQKIELPRRIRVKITLSRDAYNRQVDDKEMVG